MTAFRPDAEIRAAFEQLATLLDEAVRAARTCAGGGLQVLDRSNRSGFDKSGFPYFFYEVILEDRRTEGPIARAQVGVSFFEPFDSSDQRKVTLAWVAEQFWPGSAASLSRQAATRELSGEELASPDRVAALILESLAAARCALAGQRGCELHGHRPILYVVAPEGAAPGADAQAVIGAFEQRGFERRLHAGPVVVSELHRRAREARAAAILLCPGAAEDLERFRPLVEEVRASSGSPAAVFDVLLVGRAPADVREGDRGEPFLVHPSEGAERLSWLAQLILRSVAGRPTG